MPPYPVVRVCPPIQLCVYAPLSSCACMPARPYLGTTGSHSASMCTDCRSSRGVHLARRPQQPEGICSLWTPERSAVLQLRRWVPNPPLLVPRPSRLSCLLGHEVSLAPFTASSRSSWETTITTPLGEQNGPMGCCWYTCVCSAMAAMPPSQLRYCRFCFFAVPVQKSVQTLRRRGKKGLRPVKRERIAFLELSPFAEGARHRFPRASWALWMLCHSFPPGPEAPSAPSKYP